MSDDDILPLIKVHDYFHGVSDEALKEVVRHARVTLHPAGSVVHEANEPLHTVCFVLRGRLKVVRIDARGTESFFHVFGRGEQYGLLLGVLAEPVPVRIFALEPTTLLRLDHEQAVELSLTNPDLRRVWLRTFAGSVRKEFFGAAPKRATMMLALIHESPGTHWVAERLIGRLCEADEKLGIFGASDQWRTLPNVRFRSFNENGRELEIDQIRDQVTRWQDADRIIFDVPAGLKPAWAMPRAAPPPRATPIRTPLRS